MKEPKFKINEEILVNLVFRCFKNNNILAKQLVRATITKVEYNPESKDVTYTYSVYVEGKHHVHQVLEKDMIAIAASPFKPIEVYSSEFSS